MSILILLYHLSQVTPTPFSHVLILPLLFTQGTRSKYVEHFLKTEKAHKHLVFVLNKCDLVPTWVTKGWLVNLSKEHPTLAFHATLKKSFGKGTAFCLERARLSYPADS
jgi:nuclear GTP-binding protein